MSLYSFDLDNLDEKLAKDINKIIEEYGINEKYIWRKYYNPNFEIFKVIDAKYPWVALKTEKFKEKLGRILNAQIKYKKEKIESLTKKEVKNKNIKNLEENKEKALNTLVEMHKKEREEYENKKSPLVFFNDLFWIADSNQDELLSILKESKDNLKAFIKKIINLYIEKYKLGLIVVTDVKAAEYVKSAIDDSKEDNCVYIYPYDKDNQKKEIPIIFSGYIANGMDQFSKARLKKDIKEYYKKDYNT